MKSTDVFFIKNKHNQVVAVFPHDYIYNYDNCLSYTPTNVIGSKYEIITKLKYMSADLATTDESVDVWNELTQRGYELNLIERQ